jgi:hypothetical protein
MYKQICITRILKWGALIKTIILCSYAVDAGVVAESDPLVRVARTKRRGDSLENPNPSKRTLTDFDLPNPNDGIRDLSERNDATETLREHR